MKTVLSHWILLALCPVPLAAFSRNTLSRRATWRPLQAHSDNGVMVSARSVDASDNNARDSNNKHPSSQRRYFLQASSSVGLALTATTILGLPTTANAAAESTSSSSSTTLTVQSILQGLRNVPTFCIVNDQGAAYMLYKRNEGFAKGYAFTTYEGADVVLKDALVTAEKGGYSDTWKTATITTIPADIALRLTLQPRQRQSQREQSASSILFLIPGAADRDAAMQIDKTKFADQGKVPLFYLDTFRNSQGALPLYFNPRDLVQDWQRSTGNDDSNAAVPPRIQCIDLVTMFGYVVRGRAAELPTVLQSNALAFVPHAESVNKAKELQAAGLVPYKLDQMMI